MSEADLRTELDAVRAALRAATDEIDNLKHTISMMEREHLLVFHGVPYTGTRHPLPPTEPTDAPF